MSYSTPWLEGIQAVGSSPVFRFPNVCPCESKFCNLHRLLIAPVAPNAQKIGLDSCKSYGRIATLNFTVRLKCQREKSFTQRH
jgi:hypothetical protein